MSKKFSVKYLSESDYENWNTFITSSPEGSIYYTPEYLDVLCTATGGRFSILSVLQNDEIVGGVALYEEDSRFGKIVAPRLLLYYNGIVLRDYETSYPSKRTGRHLEIMTALEETLSEKKYGRLYLKSRHPIHDVRLFKKNGWIVESDYTYEVCLTDLDQLWSRVEQNLRRLVKRCTDQNIQFTEDDDFDSFFHLHMDTHKRKATPIYLPEDRFKIYFDSLRSQGLCRLYHARMPDGLSISTQLVLLGSHPVSHTVSAGVDVEHAKLGATAFLRWKVFEDLSRLGFTGNDLTDAPLNPVSHFKSQLGADLKLYLVVRKPDSFKYHYSKKLGKSIYNSLSMVKNFGRNLRRGQKNG